VALLKRTEDAEKPVNLRLRFAVAAEGEGRPGQRLPTAVAWIFFAIFRRNA